MTSEVASAAVSTSAAPGAVSSGAVSEASALTTSSASVGFASSLAKRLWKDVAIHCCLDTKAGRAAVMMDRCCERRIVEGFAAIALEAARLKRNLYIFYQCLVQLIARRTTVTYMKERIGVVGDGSDVVLCFAFLKVFLTCGKF